MIQLVSIIIPAYNAEAFLSEAVQSSLSQTYAHKEIIIVDDGSTDKTLKIAQEFEARGVKVISQTNQGASAARNLGYLESKGDFIQFLDADDILSPDKIDQQMRILGNLEDVICAGKWSLFYDSISLAETSPNELWKNFENPIDWIVTAWTKQRWMHPSAWLTPRKLIVKGGLWNENLSLHDDGEFFCRILLQSQRVLFCESAHSFYRKGNPESLSSVSGEKAIKSHFTICELYEKQLLAKENSVRTRKACAANYRSFYFEHYPGNTQIRLKALETSERLGGSDLGPSGTELFYLLKKFTGWKLAKRLERFYYSHGLNRSALKKRIKLIR